MQEGSFGREFYEAGDPYVSTNPNDASSSANEFEVVSRRKNRDRKKVSSQSNNNNSVGNHRMRWGEETAAREGYREHQSSNNSNRSFNNAPVCNKNNVRSTNQAIVKSSSNIPSKKKSPINFEEAPRTPHDSDFMARLSANNVGDRNTATSAPNSDCSDSDGDDSVHSMPPPSTTPRPHIVHQPKSIDSAASQTSYANIARLAGTANKSQVRRNMSLSQAGAGSIHTSSTSSGTHSAAACATSDQSLSVVWPKISGSGGLSSATVTKCAATGAATSAPAIPNAVGRTGETFASATVHGGSNPSGHRRNQQNPLSFTKDYFPPLKSSSAATNKQLSFEREGQAGNVSNQNPVPDVRENSPRYSNSSDGIESNTEIKNSRNPVNESSPLVSRNSDSDNSSLPSLSGRKSRNSTTSSIKENTPDGNSCHSVNTSPTPSTHAVTNPSVLNNNNRAISDNSHNNRILQQVSSNIDNNMLAQQSKPPEYIKNAPINTISNHVKSSNDRTSSFPSKTYKRQNDPVVFADPLQLDDGRNSNLSFMFGSNEDLIGSELVGPNVTANNLANANDNTTHIINEHANVTSQEQHPNDANANVMPHALPSGHVSVVVGDSGNSAALHQQAPPPLNTNTAAKPIRKRFVFRDPPEDPEPNPYHLEAARFLMRG